MSDSTRTTHVYGSYTQDELNAQYDTAKQVAGGDVAPYFARMERESASAREALTLDANRRYGAHERATIDFFPAPREGAPLLVWVHGGYWRRLSKDATSFVAPPVVAAGGAVAVVNYPLAPEAKLEQIVDAVRSAYAYAVEHAYALNADAANVYVGGHSVGAQLAGMVAATFEVRGLLALSGLYDLEPIRLSHVNEWIAMDAATARENSPLFAPPRAAAPLLIATGEREQPEFHRQQRAYAEAWRGWGGEVREPGGAGLDHFSIVLELANADSTISRALRELMHGSGAPPRAQGEAGR